MQQINLYLPEFRPRTDWLKFEFCLGFALSFLLAMGFYQYTVIRQHTHLVKTVESLEAKVKSLAGQTAVLKIKPSSDERGQLEKKATELRQSLKNRQAIAAVIGGQSLGNRDGFSRYLLAMSKHLVAGISLNSFDFDQGGKFAAFTGHVLHPEIVPMYINLLQQDDVFVKTKFGSLAISATAGNAQFSLSGNHNNVSVGHQKNTEQRVVK